MKKQLLCFFALLSFVLSYAQFSIIQAPDVYLCGDSGGFVIYNFDGVADTVLGNLPATDYNVTFHTTQADANNGVAPITSTATGQSPTTYFVRVESNTNPNDFQTTSYEMYINLPPSVPFQVYTVCDYDENDGVTIADLSLISQQMWSASGNPPTIMDISYYATTSDAAAQTNALPQLYTSPIQGQFSLYAVCQFIQTGCSTIVPVQVIVAFCGSNNQPQNIVLCTDGPTTCFDLTSNTPLVLTGLNPTDYTVTYHTTLADAEADTAAIADPSNLCTDLQSEVIYIRLEENASGSYDIFNFYIFSQMTVAGTTLQTMVQCDENNDGIVTFDLPTAAAQLNTTNALTYYTNSNDASAGTNPLGSPSSFSISSPNNISTVIFIREEVVGGCDIIHSLPINSLVNCNLANACAAANSLCNSLGIPFSNTININSAEPFYYGCLGSTPNPTWFYIPISQAGTVNLQIEQNTTVDFTGGGLDVDYICYGPFTSPSAACMNPSQMANSIVSCSYSAAPIEFPQILNAQAGQYYLIMVTNFSNFPGYIKITEMGTSQAEIDCTGIRLTAFLDSDGNGTQGAGEPNFPLGEFNYELNNDGTIHNITSPTGTYSIYDINAVNSYDISYSIDPLYAANYSLTTSSYSNINVIPGAGMQDFYFPITVAQSYNDLAVSIIPNQAPRPGFTYTNIVRYTNLGSQTAASGTVTFTKDPLVTITGNSEIGAVSTPTGFTYNFTNLLPFESRDIIVTMLVPNIPVVAIGNLLTNSADIIPLTGDVSPENNSTVSSQVIIGSYDPNDKMESRGGQILISDFDSEDYLYYTVRFENTGTASAINVKITDVLDSRLNASSLRMVSSSHDYILDRVGNLLKWNFDNILLPSTSQNSLLSKGFVHFKVKPNPGYAVGDIIPNSASIFFDFNPAIVTNTFNTEFVSQLEIPGFVGNEFTIYPNPANDILNITVGDHDSIKKITIYDMLGKVIKTTLPENNVHSTTMELSGVSSGLYIVEIISNSSTVTQKKLIIQ